MGKPCGMACWEAVVLVLVVEVTLPVELLLPVPLPSPFESSRLNENLFGLRLKLATLFVTYSCKELKKLIFAIMWFFCSFVIFLRKRCLFSSEYHRRLPLKCSRGSFPRTKTPSRSTRIDFAKDLSDIVRRRLARLRERGRSLDRGRNFRDTWPRRNIDFQPRPFAITALQVLPTILPRDFCSHHRSHRTSPST